MALVLAAFVVAAASGATRPRWTEIPTANFHQDAVVWSSGRVWFLKSTGTGGFRIRSARAAGGRLSDWKTATPTLGRGGWGFLKSSIRDHVVFTTTTGGAAASVLTVRLMPNGQLGAPAALEGAAPPASSTGASVVQLRDRAVRLNGISRGGFANALGVCCDIAGKVVGFGSLPASVYAHAVLGVDRGGRLWMAWASGRGGPRSQARMVELDPTILKVRGQIRTAPGFQGFVKIKALVCAETCRVVVEGTVGKGRNRATKIGSWAPGEAALTTMRVPQKAGCRGFSCGSVIDARDDGGKLTIAYSADGSQLGYTIGTARGDARGRNLRRVSSIRQPAQLGSFARGMTLNSTPAGALGSDGFAAFAFYSSGRRAVLRVALLPVR